MTAPNDEEKSPKIGTKEPEQKGDLANIAKGSSQAGPFGPLPEEHHWSEQSGARWAGSPDCAVAQTKKGALVVLSDYSDDQWKGWAVFNSFEELKASEQYPDSLVAAVADVLDIDHIEELDI